MAEIEVSAIREETQRIVQQIVRRFHPLKVILFGSYAYGQPHEGSDLDLLVVMETPKGEFKTIMDISNSLPALTFSVDIIARSRAVINRRKDAGDFFLREITEKGKVLYARDH